jgi:hypothetical protein
MLRAEPPKVPDHIDFSEEAMPQWWAIVKTREYEAWTAVDLEHAANLAMTLWQLARLNAELMHEEAVTQTDKGAVVNPKFKMVEGLTRVSVALSRMLHVHPEATAGLSRDDKKRSAKQREMAAIREAAQDDDGLIAGPMH